MKVFISSDMEGTAGVVDWDHVTSTGRDYDYFTGLLTAEVNAAINGALRGGAREFLVNDSHSKMINMRPDELAGNARYLSGRFKPMYMMEGLDESFDAIFFVSYHGSMSGKASTLSHTFFPEAFGEVRVNGRVVGESGINALAAKAFAVPIVLITGDDVTAEEIEPFCPGIHTVVVKRSVSRFDADSLHPHEARERIENEAFLAISTLSSAQSVAIDLPVTIDIDFRTPDYLELASRIEGVQRVDHLRARLVSNDPLEIYRNFVTVVFLCRGLSERK